MSSDTREDKEEILNRVTELPSFTKKLGQPKLANWFSWNQQMHEHGLSDFFPTKMIFENHLPSEPDPDESNAFAGAGRDARAQLRAMLQSGGGVRLAFKLMTSELHTNEKILYFAEKACWDWYTKQITTIKTPKHAEEYSVRMAAGGWTADEHLGETFQNVCCEPSFLRQMDIPMGRSNSSLQAVMIAWHIVKNRAWSLTKHDQAPESYAGILSQDQNVARRAAETLQREHRNVLSLEQAVHSHDVAKTLWDDIVFLKNSVARITFEMFAKDQYSERSRGGRKVLLGCCRTLPDNKIVEDVHQPIRLEARGNPQQKTQQEFRARVSY